MEKAGTIGRRFAHLAAMVVVLGLLAVPADAANTVTISDPGNSGPGTLRDTLAAAGPGETILIPGSFTITLASPLDVNQPAPGVTIGATGSGMPTLNGNHVTRIIHVGASSGLSVRGLRFTGGRVNGDNGAAIQMFGPSALSVSNSVFDDNGTTGGGAGGAIQLNSNVPTTISNSTFTGNFSDLNGGAIDIFTPNTTTISQSTISANHTGAGGRGGGIQVNGGELDLSASTVSGNTSGTQAGGIEVDTPGVLNMTNTTVTGNTASTTYGGGVGFNGGNGGTILNSTIAGNVANSAGGGLGVPGSSSSDVHVKNSVVAGNTAATDSNCGGPGSGTRFTSDGHNLDSGTSCGFAATGDRSADPRLGPLANNGGPTKTMALLPGSPAIDTGDNSGCPAADQRGQVRPVWGARALVCDIGAFEVAPSSEFQITANAKCKTRRCSAVLVHLRLPGPGSLTAADASAAGGGRASAKRKALIEPTSVTARGSGPLVLRLNLTATARTKLGRKNKLRISVRFLFSPRGGTPHAKTQLLKIKPRRGRHHS